MNLRVVKRFVVYGGVVLIGVHAVELTALGILLGKVW